MCPFFFDHLTLQNLGATYRAINKKQLIEPTYLEALKIRRELAKKNPSTYLPDVAETLVNLANSYEFNMQDLTDSYTTSKKIVKAENNYIEGLTIYRQLSVSNPNMFLPYVATTLSNLGNYYMNIQKMSESLKAHTESLTIRRQLAKKDPNLYLPDLAKSLNNFGLLLMMNMEIDKATLNFEESEQIFRDLAKKTPSLFDLHLSQTLVLLGFAYEAIEKIEKSQAYFLEGQKLAKKYPNASFAQRILIMVEPKIKK